MSAGPAVAVRDLAHLRRYAAEPSTWVAGAILALPLSSANGPTGARATPSDVFLVIAAITATLIVLRGRRMGVVRSVPAVGLAAVVTVTTMAALVAPSFPASVVGAARYVQLFLVAPLAVMISLRSRKDAAIILGSLVGLAVIEGSIGVVQTLTGTGASIGGEYIRAVGTFGAYNILALAELCALGMVVCLAYGMVESGRRRTVALVVAAALLLPLALSLSRGVWVAAGVAAVVVVSRGRLERWLVAVGALTVAAIVSIPPVLASGTDLGRRVGSLLSLVSDPDQSFTDRLQLWSAAAGMAVDNPVTGVGVRAFAAHRDAYAGLSMQAWSDISIGGDYQQVPLESPHSFYLLVASEQGLVAAAVYLTVFAIILVRGLMRVGRLERGMSSAVALAGVGAFTIQLVTMLTGDLGGPGSILLAVSIGLAAWAAADVDLEDGPSAGPSPGRRRWSASVGAWLPGLSHSVAPTGVDTIPAAKGETR